MEGLVKGNIVVAAFPYSDLSQIKRRPTLVLAVLQGRDAILCEITSQTVSNPYVVSISNADLTGGTLSKDSYIRPEKILTIDRNLIEYKIGSLSQEKVEEAIAKIIEIINR